MLIRGKQYNKVNERTIDGIRHVMYRADESKPGAGHDDCIVLSHSVGDKLDLDEIAKVKKSKKVKHKEKEINPKTDWHRIKDVI